MNPRNTGILLLVAAALGAFVYFYEIEGKEQRQEQESASKRLFPGVDEDAIQSLSLTTSDGAAARLERRGGTWRLVEPVEFPADVFAADGLASNLSGLASEAVLEDPQPPEEYGLGEGAKEVRFATADREYVLRLGNKTPIGSNSYARVEGADDVVTVATYKAQSFQKSLTDLRERRILDFDRGAVRRLEARWPGGGVTLVREATPTAGGEEGGEDAAPAPGWRLTAPLEGRADAEEVDRLLSDLSYLRADGFVDAPSPAQVAGLASPAFEIELTGEAPEDGDAPTWKLSLGDLYEGDKRLVRAAQPSLYTIPAERLSDFPREIVAYRFRRLAKFSVDDVAQVDFFFHPQTGDPVAFSAERGEDGWTSSPEKLSPGKVARMVSELSHLQAGDILAEDASEEDLQRLGLAPPRTILSVFGAVPDAASGGEGAEAPAAPRLAEVQIGNVEGSEWILARAAGDPAVYRLSYELAEHVPVSLEAFRNRFLSDEGAAPDAAEPADGEVEEFLTPSEESP